MNKSILKKNLCSFVAQYQARHSTFTRWRSPLMAVASADDPLFITLKKVVSSSHALPKDLLSKARSVVAFFIPFEKAVAKSNGPGLLASEEWARAYIETNATRNVLGIRKIMKISAQLMCAENVL
jgi:epoxyqueuosine reductase QueG